MEITGKRGELRLIELNCPYDIWGNSVVQGLFCEMVNVKLLGYLNEYAYGTMPVDTSDFYSTHYLICRETLRGPEPIASYRWTSLERSKRHGQIFSGLALARAAGSERHVRAVEAIMTRCERENKALEYIGSWTMNPAVRKDRELTAMIRGLFDAIYVFHTQRFGCEIVFGGTLRFKMDRYMSKFGAMPLGLEGETLPPVKVPFLMGEPVLMMHMSTLRPECVSEAERWGEWWKNRLVIALSEEERRESLAEAA